jgi:hypothetical protein
VPRHCGRATGARRRLAFTGFWMLLGVVRPLVLTSASDIPGAVVGIVVLVTGVGLFFYPLCSQQLHTPTRVF